MTHLFASDRPHCGLSAPLIIDRYCFILMPGNRPGGKKDIPSSLGVALSGPNGLDHVNCRVR
jgi:hypothetical protein